MESSRVKIWYTTIAGLCCWCPHMGSSRKLGSPGPPVFNFIVVYCILSCLPCPVCPFPPVPPVNCLCSLSCESSLLVLWIITCWIFTGGITLLIMILSACLVRLLVRTWLRFKFSGPSARNLGPAKLVLTHWFWNNHLVATHPGRLLYPLWFSWHERETNYIRLILV